MNETPRLNALLAGNNSAKGALIMKAFIVLVVGLNAYFTAAFGYESAAILRTGIWWLDGAVGALYYLALLDGAAIAWHYGQISGRSATQRSVAVWMKGASAGASVLMSLAYVTLYTSLWDASGLVLYAQIGGAIIIYLMTAAQFVAYLIYRDADPSHVEADARSAMAAEAMSNKLENQAKAMTDALDMANNIMAGYTRHIAEQQAHSIVNSLLDLMNYAEQGADDLPQLPPSRTPSTPLPATNEQRPVAYDYYAENENGHNVGEFRTVAAASNYLRQIGGGAVVSNYSGVTVLRVPSVPETAPAHGQNGHGGHGEQDTPLR